MADVDNKPVAGSKRKHPQKIHGEQARAARMEERRSRLRQVIAEKGFGLPNRALAELVGTNHETIREDMMAIRREWAKSEETLDQAREREIAQTYRNEQRLLNLHVETGDAQYFALAMKCIDQRRAILGLDAERAANRQADATQLMAEALAGTLPKASDQLRRLDERMLITQGTATFTPDPGLPPVNPGGNGNGGTNGNGNGGH